MGKNGAILGKPLNLLFILHIEVRFNEFVFSNSSGQAWVGSACKKNDAGQTFDAVTIFRDDGVFKGVHAVAHELGHT